MMESATAATTPVIVIGKDWKESLDLIQNGLLLENEEEDYPSIIANCSKWYNSDEVPGSVQTTLMHIYLRALLATHEYTKVVELCTAANNDDDNDMNYHPYADEHIYALYRSKNYRACLNLASNNSNNNSNSSFRQHIRAQCHFRLKETEKAMKEYQAIVSTMEDTTGELSSQQEGGGSAKMEVWTNMCAVGLANDYYDFHDDETKDASSSSSYTIGSFLDSFEGEVEDYPYELAYNYGTWLALQGKPKDATKYLKSAYQNATSDEERMAIQFTLQQTSDNSTDIANFIENDDAYSQYPHLNWVVEQQSLRSTNNDNNTALLKPQDITLLHLTPSQIRKYWYNQCVLQLHIICKNDNHQNKKRMNTNVSGDEDNDELFCVMMDHLMSHIGNLDGSKKKKNSAVSMVNYSHELYWTTKAVILNHLKQYHQQQQSQQTNMKKKKKSKKKSINYPTLEEVEEKIKLEMENNRNKSELLELAHIHLQLYKSQTSSSNNEKKPSIPDIISTLECLPTRPAIQATLASLYHQNGQSDKVQSILNHLREQQSSDNDNNNNMAQLYMQMSMYSNALDLLSNENNDDNTCQAMKVIALHELGQVEDAMDEWKSFKELNNIMDDYSSVDAEALEANVIPRLHKSSITHASSKTHDSKKKKEKKRCEAVLKKRAKQREAYLEKHPDLKNKTPDPERWIPKRDRVAKRRYNSNKHMNAAQGITSQKDMNKLDAYARTTNPHSQSSQNQPSTRHMSVSATGKNRRAAR